MKVMFLKIRFLLLFSQLIIISFLNSNSASASGQGMCKTESEVISLDKMKSNPDGSIFYSLKFKALTNEGYCGVGSPRLNLENTLTINPELLKKEKSVSISQIKAGQKIDIIQRCHDGMGMNGPVGGCTFLNLEFTIAK